MRALRVRKDLSIVGCEFQAWLILIISAPVSEPGTQQPDKASRDLGKTSVAMVFL